MDMDDDLDIYDDLVVEDNNDQSTSKGDHNYLLNDLVLMEDSQRNLIKEKKALEDELKNVRQDLEKLTKANKILKANISSLFKTAKAEMKRKDERIDELSEKVDQLISQKNKGEYNSYFYLKNRFCILPQTHIIDFRLKKQASTANKKNTTWNCMTKS